MKSFEVIFIQSYQVRHSIEIEAKTAKQARKIAEIAATEIDPGDDQLSCYITEDADDFSVSEIV